MEIQSSYLTNAFRAFTRQRIVKNLTEAIKLVLPKKDFETITFRGVSGALISPFIADKLRKGLTVVRKQDGTHSSFPILEGVIRFDSYIIIDDTIASGRTMQIIFNRVSEFNPSAVCRGIFLYHDDYHNNIIDERTSEIIQIYGFKMLAGSAYITSKNENLRIIYDQNTTQN